MLKLWNKSREWVSGMTLRRRILLTMITMILFTSLVLGLIIFQISKSTIERNYQRAHVHNLQVSSKMMDIYLNNIVEESRSLLENKQFINIMETEKSNSRYFSSRNQLSMDNMLGKLTIMNSMINGMLVVNENGNWRYYAKSKNYSGTLNKFYTTDDLLKQTWVSTADRGDGKEMFYPYDVLLGNKAMDGFCFVKKLISPYDQKPFGYLVVSIDKRIWTEVFGNDTEGFETNGYLVATDSETLYGNGVVYFTGQDEEEDSTVKAYHSNDNSDFLFSSYQNSTTGWNFVNVITKNELESDSDNIRNVLFVIVFVMILVSIAAATLISNYMTKPLQKLEKTMASVEAGNLRVEAEFDRSEVGLIGNRFKSLVNNNLELRERLLNLEIREKEGQLLLLQSQINPHFLYNTLDALYLMALIEQADDIAEMVQALSDMFKLSLNKGDKLITLRDEIARMNDYLKIQNFRFHDRFTLHLDVGEDVMEHKILTFILQPIVENAVYHGLESQIGPGNIYLKAREADGVLYISIRDDGVGMEDIRQIEKGYGINNIKERMKLYYGDAAGISFYSEINRGTTVELVIPGEAESPAASLKEQPGN